jgi:hypothetical protein
VLTAVEDAFGIRFTELEVIGLNSKNVGALQRLVDKKVGASAHSR